MLRPAPVQFLILGAGWSSQFLIPLLTSSHITHASTTRSGSSTSIPFTYDPTSSSTAPYKLLPSASTILIVFPLKGPHQSSHLITLYREIHGADNKWIQLGSTGIFTSPCWNDCNSEYDKENERAMAEDELLGMGGCVLNLAGLYGGERDPKNWVTRVATTKEQVKNKKALHMIHGADVAKAIVAVHEKFTVGKRWLLTDLRVYDWWDLIQDWGAVARERARGRSEKETGQRLEEKEAAGLMGEEKEVLEYEKWVGELMVEQGVRALPRGAETLGRVLDSRAFWKEMGVWPGEGRV